MKRASLGLIVIGYDSEDVWPAFFASLAQSSIVPSSVVVVENSPNKPTNLGDLRDSKITLVHLPHNPGYGSAANEGMLALPKECTHVAICNPDITFDSQALKGLLAALGQNLSAGIAGPKILNLDGSTYPSARAFPGIRIGIGHAVFGEIWKQNPWTKKYLGQYQGVDPRTVDWLSGACLVTRRDSFDEVGGFDPEYFMFFEDVDLCFRLKKKGWRSIYVPSSSITHSGAHATGPRMATMVKVHHESAKRFLFSLYGGPAYWPLRQVLKLGLFLRSLIAPKLHATNLAKN